MCYQRINRLGSIVGEKYLAIRPFHRSGKFCGARIQHGGIGMVLIDELGERVGNDSYFEVWREQEGLIPVQFTEDQGGWVNTNGEILFCENNICVGNQFQNGLVPASRNGHKWGLLDLEGKWVIDPAHFDIIEPLGAERLAVGYYDQQRNSCVRLADSFGNLIGSMEFGSIDSFLEGYATVWNGDLDGGLTHNYITLDGRLVLDEWI
jgi:hypothetical protein